MSPAREGDRRLAGRRILVTRRPEQASSLTRRLEAQGATVVEAATIQVVAPEDTRPLDAALLRLHRYHWLLFTSANAVRFVAERLKALGREPRAALEGLRIGSVGPSTTEAFRARFPAAAPPLEPASEFRAEGLLAALGAEVAGQAFLLPTSDRAGDTLPQTLTARGARVDVVIAYRTVPAPALAGRLAEALAEGLDLVTFASPSAVDGFVSAAGKRARGLPAAVIGPVTDAAARAAGLDVRVTATPSTAEGLVTAIAVYFENLTPHP